MRVFKVPTLYLLFAIWLTAHFAAEAQAVPEPSSSLKVGDTSLPVWQRNDRTGMAKGSVLLVLGAGDAGAWPHSLASLTESLPDHGWHTLAVRSDVSMPNLEDLDKRVNAALELVRAEAGKPIVLVAASTLARNIALQSVNKGFGKQPSAFVFLNRPAFDSADDEQKFHQQEIAVLEVHEGQLASKHLLQQRLNLAAEHGQRFYQQIRLPPVGPNWTNTPDRLGKKISGWLKRSYK